jgi:broad specificity phosphatase PhoE
MTTRLTLLCHASTLAVRTSTFPADEPLDSQGQQKLAGVSLGKRHWDRCFVSPALRARQTAEALKLAPTIEPALRECDYGHWAGQSFDDVQAREPEAVAAWLTDPAAAPHGGESIATLIVRVSSWLDAQRIMPGTAIAVTHASVIRAAIVSAIEAEPRSFWRIDVAPLSLARLSCSHGRWTLVSVGPGAARGIDPED